MNTRPVVTPADRPAPEVCRGLPLLRLPQVSDPDTTEVGAHRGSDPSSSITWWW